MSTNAFGPADLDLRPPEMRRSTMSLWVQECPKCGYVSADIEEKSRISRSYLMSDEYHSCEGKAFKSSLARTFYRQYLICRQTKNTEDAFFAVLHAAWACDDRLDKKNATACREIGISLISQLLGNSSQKENRDTMLLLKADLLRRTGHFDTLIAEYENVRFSEEIMNRILQFQLQKAAEKDTGCYTVADAAKDEE